eukprot:3625323-Amphidinium_carterae.1
MGSSFLVLLDVLHHGLNDLQLIGSGCLMHVTWQPRVWRQKGTLTLQKRTRMSNTLCLLRPVPRLVAKRPKNKGGPFAKRPSKDARCPCTRCCRFRRGADPLVLLNYTPEGEHSADQLKLLAGDVVYVHQKHSSGWWGGHKAGSNLTGWFPASLVEPFQVP